MRLKRFLTHAVAVKPYVRRNSANELIYGEPIIARGHVEPSRARIVRADGTETVANARFFVAPSPILPAISEQDVIAHAASCRCSLPLPKKGEFLNLLRIAAVGDPTRRGATDHFEALV